MKDKEYAEFSEPECYTDKNLSDWEVLLNKNITESKESDPQQNENNCDSFSRHVSCHSQSFH